MGHSLPSFTSCCMPLLLGFLNPQACSCPRAFALPALSAHNCLSPRHPTDSQLTRFPGLEPVVCQVCTEMYPEQERQAVTGESPHGSKKHLGYTPYATWRLLDPHFVSACLGLLLRRRDYTSRILEWTGRTDQWCLKLKHGLETGTSRSLTTVCGFQENHSFPRSEAVSAAGPPALAGAPLPRGLRGSGVTVKSHICFSSGSGRLQQERPLASASS